MMTMSELFGLTASTFSVIFVVLFWVENIRAVAIAGTGKQ